MISEASYTKCSEIYVVEKTVEAVVRIGEENHTIRIEAVRDLRTGQYSTRAYREEDVTLQPTYPQTGEQYDRNPESFQIWVNYDLPWTRSDSADAGLSQALGFLTERVS